MMYEYRCWVRRVVDGDTLHLGVDLGLDVATHLTTRLYGLNTPEMGTVEGRAAKEYVQSWLLDHDNGWGTFVLRTVKDKREKYGRYLGTIVADDGADLNADLLAAGHAAAYPA